MKPVCSLAVWRSSPHIACRSDDGRKRGDRDRVQQPAPRPHSREVLDEIADQARCHRTVQRVISPHVGCQPRRHRPKDHDISTAHAGSSTADRSGGARVYTVVTRRVKVSKMVFGTLASGDRRQDRDDDRPRFETGVRRRGFRGSWRPSCRQQCGEQIRKTSPRSRRYSKRSDAPCESLQPAVFRTRFDDQGDCGVGVLPQP
jgi:hypothetical protein